LVAVVALLVGIAHAEPPRTLPKSVLVGMTRRTVVVEVISAPAGCTVPLEVTSALEEKRVIVEVLGHAVVEKAPLSPCQPTDRGSHASFELSEQWLTTGPARREIVVRLKGATNRFALDVDAKDKRLRLSKISGSNAKLAADQDSLVPVPYGGWAARVQQPRRYAGDVVIDGPIVVKDNDEKAVRETFRKYLDDLRAC
jgi:hypothetical protein